MSVGLVIITHGEIGRSLIRAAEFILDRSLGEIRFVGITQSGAELPDPESIRSVMADADAGDGVLVLTDLACASPSNIAEKLSHEGRGKVVSGINLPMLLRTWNYRHEPLDVLAERASEGGLKGIGIRGT